MPSKHMETCREERGHRDEMCDDKKPRAGEKLKMSSLEKKTPQIKGGGSYSGTIKYYRADKVI